MKRKLLPSLILLNIIIILFSTTVIAETDKKIKHTEKLGNTRNNAMHNENLAYEDEYFYLALKDKESNKLIKRNTKDDSIEIILEEDVSCINVLNDKVYGYINYNNSSNKKSGIYQINSKDKTTKLIYDKMKPSQLIVIDDYIYFSRDGGALLDKGIYRINIDGSNFETLYKGYIDSFTVYKNKIYLTLKNKIFSVDFGGSNLTKLAEEFDLWSDFTIYDDYIYIKGHYLNKELDEFEFGIVKISTDGKQIELLPNTDYSYEHDIKGGYIYFYSLNEGVYKMKLDGTEREEIILTSGIDVLSVFDNYIYFNIKKDYNNDTTNEKWYYNIQEGSYTCLTSNKNKDYNEVKTILQKSIYNTQTANRLDTKLNIKYEQENDNHVVESEIKRDRINNVAYYTSIKKENNENESFSEFWYNKNYVFSSEVQDKWKYIKHNEQDIKYINEIYNFLDVGHDYLSNLTLSETSDKYILKGKAKFDRVFLKLEDNIFFSHYFHVANNGILELNIQINKQSYLIEKITMVFEKYIGEDELLLSTVTAECINEFPTKKLTIPYKVKSTISKDNKSKKYIESAQKSNEAKKYKEAFNYSNTALNIYYYALDAHLEKGIALYHQGKYEMAIEEYEKYIEKSIDEEINIDVYLLLAEANNRLENYKETPLYILEYLHYQTDEKYRQRAIKEGIIAINGLGSSLMTIPYYELMLQLEPDSELIISSIAEELFYNTDYNKCIEFAKKYEEVNNRLLWYYKGASYIKIGEYDKGIDCYNKILNMPKHEVITNDIVYYELGVIYCIYVQDYDLAEKCQNKIDKSDENHYIAILKKLIKECRRPQAQKVSYFVDKNYLYSKNNKDFYHKVDEFRHKDSVTIKEIIKFINDIRKDDKFSWVIYGEDYDSLIKHKQKNEISYKQLDEFTEYIKVDNFYKNTGNKFVNYIDSIEYPEDKTLIVDLRDNAGGQVSSCIKMMDILLPECTSAYLIDKDGRTRGYYSDEYMVEFKDIKILVNNNSASCSEMFALSLKKYLDNVTILGKNTYGKGVVHRTYEDKNNKYVIYLVSHYWNVLEENINNKGIKPDIIIKGKELDDFLNVIKELEKE